MRHSSGCSETTWFGCLVWMVDTSSRHVEQRGEELSGMLGAGWSYFGD